MHIHGGVIVDPERNIGKAHQKCSYNLATAYVEMNVERKRRSVSNFISGEMMLASLYRGVKWSWLRQEKVDPILCGFRLSWGRFFGEGTGR